MGRHRQDPQRHGSLGMLAVIILLALITGLVIATWHAPDHPQAALSAERPVIIRKQHVLQEKIREPHHHGAPGTYTVQPGDTLWGIAGKLCPSPGDWTALWQANPQITSPGQIFPGETLAVRC